MCPHPHSCYQCPHWYSSRAGPVRTCLPWCSARPSSVSAGGWTSLPWRVSCSPIYQSFQIKKQVMSAGWSARHVALKTRYCGEVSNEHSHTASPSTFVSPPWLSWRFLASIAFAQLQRQPSRTSWVRLYVCPRDCAYSCCIVKLWHSLSEGRQHTLLRDSWRRQRTVSTCSGWRETWWSAASSQSHLTWWFRDAILSSVPSKVASSS